MQTVIQVISANVPNLLIDEHNPRWVREIFAIGEREGVPYTLLAKIDHMLVDWLLASTGVANDFAQ